MISHFMVQRHSEPSQSAGPFYSATNTQNLRIIGVAVAAVSFLADLVALFWFSRTKRKFRHTLIIYLFAADLLKCLNNLVFGAISLADGNVKSASPYCQANGFLNEYFVEITDFAILAMIVHMSVIVLRPDATAEGEGGLSKWSIYIAAFVLGMPLVMASLAFVESSRAYTLQGAFCALPTRPVWYGVFLDWAPRHCIAITILSLTVITMLKVKRLQKKLAELQQPAPYLYQGDINATITEESDDDDDEIHSPTRLDSIVGDISKLPHPDHSRDPSPTRRSTDRHPRPASSHASLPRPASYQPTLRPASSHPAIRRPASPQRTTIVNRRSSAADLGRLRALSLPPPPLSRRRSHLDLPSRPPSIWDEIDASLARRSSRVSLRTSDFAVTYSRPGSPVKQLKRWTSRLSLSAPRESELTVLERRQRFISRQLRHTLFYPLIYLALWAGPAAASWLLYSDRWAEGVPFELAAVAVAETGLFGVVNAIYFCAREKPWTLEKARWRRKGSWDFKG